MCSTVAVGVEADVECAATALTQALGHGLERLTHDQSRDLLDQLRSVTAKCEALSLAVVAKVASDGTFTLDGAVTPGSWVHAVTHATQAESARTVRTARALQSGILPNTAAALAAGAITGRHAAVIADGIKDAPAEAVALIEPEAVAAAVDGDLRATANVMRAFQHALDPDKADEKAVRRYERAGITFSPLLGGGFAICGTADETTGAAIAAAMDQAAPLSAGDTRSPARRRLDGLHRISVHWLDSSEPDVDATARRTGKSRAQLVVTVDQDGVAGHASPGGTLTWAGPIATSTAQRLGCDAAATFVTLDESGNVIDLRRERRFFSIPQRLAMIARDGDTCCAPYCDRPAAWSDGHHLVPRAAGGPTTVANGALPCEAHHLLLHEGHWELIRLPDGRYLMRHPTTGRTLGPEPPRPGHNRPPPEPPPDD